MARMRLLWLLSGLLLTIVPVLARQPVQPITGVIDQAAPYVAIPVVVDEAGSTIIADIRVLSGDLDTVLYLVDSAGLIVAENDDRSRTDTSSYLVFPEASSGAYTIIATRYNVAAGETSGEFELLIDIQRKTEEAPSYRVSPEDLAATGFPVIEVRPEADWVVLAYYGGDNDLEPGVMNDFNEFELAGGSDEAVRIVMLMDRHPEFTTASGDWHSVKLFEIMEDLSDDHLVTFPPTLDTPPLADLGVLNSGDGELLAQYLVWAMQYFPARNYAVAFASHGAGWQGLVADYTADYSTITVPEMRQAFEVALAAAGRERFDLLVNDACSMSSVEYYAALAEFFDLSIASAEIVIDPAMDMTLFVNMLRENPEIDLRNLGQQLVDKYISYDTRLVPTDDAAYLTQAVTDLQAFDPVTAAIERFAAIVNERPAFFSRTLGEARSNTYTYSSFLGYTTKIDLGHFMSRVIVAARDERLIEAAQAVLDALNEAMLFGEAGEIASGKVSHYNVYFPESSNRFRIEYFSSTPLPEWGRMLRNYYNAVTPQVWLGTGDEILFHPPVEPNIRVTNVYPPSRATNILSPVILETEIIGRNLSHVEVTVDQIQPDSSSVRLSSERLLTDVIVDDQFERLNIWEDGVDIRSNSWDVTLPVVSDGVSSNNELLVFTDKVAFLDGYYQESGSSTWNQVSLLFGEDGRVQRVINRAAENSDALAVVTIQPGANFLSFKSVVTPDGRVSIDYGNYYVWPEGGLTYSWQPAPNGQYRIGLLVTTFGGTTGFDAVEVAVNNDGVDTSLRGETRTDFGFTVPRLSEWLRMTVYFTEDGFPYLSTQSEDGSQRVSAYVAFTDLEGNLLPDDPLLIANTILDSYGFSSDRNFTPVTIGGVETVEFTFSYETPEGVINARSFAAYDATYATGLVFAAEERDGTSAIETIYAKLTANTSLFDIAEYQTLSSAAWYLDFQSVEDVDVPVRFDWLPTQGGRWTRFSGEDSVSFAAFARLDDLEGATAQAALDLLIAENTPALAGFAISGRRTLSSENHFLDAVLYEAQRDGQAVTGRFYVTIENERPYAAWIEAPLDEAAAELFSLVLEPMVDRYTIYPME